MGYFTQPLLTVVLNEDEPEPSKRNTVTLRRWTAGQRKTVTSLAMAPIDMIAAQAAVADGGKPEVRVDMPVLRLETVKACVSAWIGPDFEGRGPSAAAIEELPPAIIDKLADACDQLNQGLSDDLKNASGEPTRTPL